MEYEVSIDVIDELFHTTTQTLYVEARSLNAAKNKVLRENVRVTVTKKPPLGRPKKVITVPVSFQGAPLARSYKVSSEK